MYALMGIGSMGVVNTLSATSAVDTIWSSLSPLEKFAGGLNQTDYDKLSHWLSNAYSSGYVVDQYDDPSAIPRPSPAEISSLVQRFNTGIYDDADLAKSSQNVTRLMDKGFFIRPFAQGRSTPATPDQIKQYTYGPPAPQRSFADELGMAAGKIAAAISMPKLSPGPGPNVYVKTQAKEPNVVPYLIGFATVGLLGVVMYTVLKRKG